MVIGKKIAEDSAKGERRGKGKEKEGADESSAILKSRD